MMRSISITPAPNMNAYVKSTYRVRSDDGSAIYIQFQNINDKIQLPIYSQVKILIKILCLNIKGISGRLRRPSIFLFVSTKNFNQNLYLWIYNLKKIKINLQMVESTLHSIKVKKDLHACMSQVRKSNISYHTYLLFNSGLLVADSSMHTAQFLVGHSIWWKICSQNIRS